MEANYDLDTSYLEDAESQVVDQGKASEDTWDGAPDGIHFFRGLLFGVLFSLPIWAVLLWILI